MRKYSILSRFNGTCRFIIETSANRYREFMQPDHFNRIPLFSVSLFMFFACTLATAAEKHVFEAEVTELLGDASRITDTAASGGYLVDLTRPGQGIKLTSVPAAEKVAIRYASMEVGTIRVKLNDQPARTVNVHSSGALTGSFLHAIIDMEIPENSVLTISRTDNDAAVNIDRIIVGNGNLGLPPTRRLHSRPRQQRLCPLELPQKQKAL